MIQARIAPLEPPYSPPVQAALDRIMPKGVPPLALFRTLAVNERVFLRVMAGGLLDRGSISLREREIVIDRTCARCGSEYEWGVHVAFFAERVGFTPEQVAATCGAEARPACSRTASACSSGWWTPSTTRPGWATRSGPPCGWNGPRSR